MTPDIRFVVSLLAVSAALPAAPLRFEPQRAGAGYVARGKGYGVSVDSRGIALTLRSAKTPLRMDFRDAGRSAACEGAARLAGASNYLIGADPAQWRTDVPGFARVECRGVYPGIDVAYYSREEQLEYDLVIASGADAARARLDFPGATLRITADGTLQVTGGTEEFTLLKPRVYQGDKLIECSYVLRSAQEAGFRLSAYDHRRPLVVDPTVVFSLYLGGSTDDAAYGVAVDSSDNSYVTGKTNSADFPGAGTRQQTSGYSAFVTKFDPSGKMVYSTYIAGTNADTIGKSITVDVAGNAWVTGATASSSFPTTPGVFQSVNHHGVSGSNGFALKLNPAGTGILEATLFGGGGADAPYRIALDGSGHVVVAGLTSSGDFPVKNGLPIKFGGLPNTMGFVTEFTADLTQLVYSTFLGGTGGDDQVQGLVVDTAGNAWVTGQTNSLDFPVRGSVLATKMPSNGKKIGFPLSAFVSKFDPTGMLLLSTYLGGSGYEFAQAIDLDSSGNVYVGGSSASTDFPGTAGAYQPQNSGSQACFIAMLDPQLETVTATYFGGKGQIYEGIYDLKIDANGNVQFIGDIGGLTLDPNDPSSDTTVYAFAAILSGDLTQPGEAVQLNTGGNANGNALALYTVPATTGSQSESGVEPREGHAGLKLSLTCAATLGGGKARHVRKRSVREFMVELFGSCQNPTLKPIRKIRTHTALTLDSKVTLLSSGNPQPAAGNGATTSFQLTTPTPPAQPFNISVSFPAGVDVTQAGALTIGSTVIPGAAAGNQAFYGGVPLSLSSGDPQTFAINGWAVSVGDLQVGSDLSADLSISPSTSITVTPSSLVMADVVEPLTKSITPVGAIPGFCGSAICQTFLATISENYPGALQTPSDYGAASGDQLVFQLNIAGAPTGASLFVTNPFGLSSGLNLASNGGPPAGTILYDGNQVSYFQGPLSNGTASVDFPVTSHDNGTPGSANFLIGIEVPAGTVLPVPGILSIDLGPLVAPFGAPTITIVPQAPLFAPDSNALYYTDITSGEVTIVTPFPTTPSTGINFDSNNGLLQSATIDTESIDIIAINAEIEVAPLESHGARDASASWLTAKLSSPTTPNTITLTADPTGLAPGVHNGMVTISFPGSSIASTSFPVSFTVNPPCNLTAAPIISSVVNGGSFLPAISAGGMITLKGSFLPAGQSHVASAGDLAVNAFPEELTCLEVDVNGLPAPISYTSAGQINAQAPVSTPSGPVSVQAIANPGTSQAIASNVFTAQSKAVAPAFFTFDGKNIAAVNAITGTIVADPSLGIPGSVTAKPGDYVSFYGTGFGATGPVVEEGQLTQGIPSLIAPYTVTIGGVTLPASGVLYGGLAPGSISGLYQFNVQIPALPNGPQPVSISIGGQSTQAGAVIAIQN